MKTFSGPQTLPSEGLSCSLSLRGQIGTDFHTLAADKQPSPLSDFICGVCSEIIDVNLQHRPMY